MLDGSVQPMPGPELNLEDTHLTRALDELAKLVDAPVQNLIPVKDSNQASADDAETENLIPQPLPEPIPIEVPLPPTPVIVTPAVNASLGASSDQGLSGDHGLLEELAALSSGMPSGVAVEAESVSVDAPRRAQTAGPSPFMTSLLCTSVFVAGMLTERFVRLFERPQRSSAPIEQKAIVDNELTGRITYKSKGGESLPDRGARILVFPQQRSGEVKLSVVGFRPSDSPADQVVANAALRALGGAGTSADDKGGYRLPIEAGSYRILVLSHFQADEESVADPDLEKLLSQYFDRPNELLGRVSHQFSPLRIKGAGDLWDHSF